MTTSTRRRLSATALSAVLLVGLPVAAGAPAAATDATPTPTPTAPATDTTSVTTADTVAPVSYALGERRLRRGDSGRDVKRLQKLLRVKRTGTFNRATKRAVKKVQRAAGLRVTGRVNQRTLKAIKRDYQLSRTSRSLPRAGSPTASRAYARAYIAAKYGWGSSQMSCLSVLWERESGWRYWVSNPNGIYRGIPQTSSRVWGPLGYTTSQYMSSPEIQIKVGTHYIKGRYGTPCGAWSFWQSHHWY